MSDTERDLERAMDDTDRLGVIGSPSSTSEIGLDILGTAVNRKLVGELAIFRYPQDNAQNYALGQIVEVQLRNIWHEDPTMRSLIRQRGRIDAVSERQDTHMGQMTVSAVFKSGEKGYEPSILGTVPSTGTHVHMVDDEILSRLLRLYQDQMFYLGKVYGSTPKLPLWFKHFGTGSQGAGEAYHIGVFGKTGSGKSVLAKMMLLAYARHKNMALIIIDPQGEFARDVRSGPQEGDFSLPLKRVMESFGKTIGGLSIRNLVLDRWELFSQILFESPFFERLTVPRGDNRTIACELLSEKLPKAKIKLEDLYRESSFERAWSLLGQDNIQRVFYRTESSRSRFDSALQEADKTEFYNDYWRPVAELFRKDRENARTVEGALRWVLDMQKEIRPVLIIDLSKEQAKGLFWNDKIQALVIKRLLSGINLIAEDSYKEKESLNSLVIIDEAHRLAPREILPEDDEGKAVRRELIDAVRTTRKYGLGWMFISQTLSSLHTEILQQLRIMFFGFGLGLGTEYQALRQLVGTSGKALDLYQLFRDPHSAFDPANKQYSFMTIGPVSPLSFAGTPLFFNAFNNVEEFMEANGLNIKKE